MSDKEMMKIVKVDGDTFEIDIVSHYEPAEKVKMLVPRAITNYFASEFMEMLSHSDQTAAMDACLEAWGIETDEEKNNFWENAC